MRGGNGGPSAMDQSNNSNCSRRSSHRASPRRGRRGRPDRGLDLPPRISGSILDTRPLHHLCTLSSNLEGISICPPLIVFERFIAAVSYGGILKLYELDAQWATSLESPLGQIQPRWTCQVVEYERFVSMTALTIPPTATTYRSTPTTASTGSGSNSGSAEHQASSSSTALGYIAFATTEGSVSMCQVFEDKEPDVLCTLPTGMINIVSLACWMEAEEENENTTSNSTTMVLHVAVGAKSGYVEEWSIHDWKVVQLVWKGSFGTTLHSLAVLKVGSRYTLSACISQTPRMGRALQSSTVEVLDRTMLVNSAPATNSNKTTGDDALKVLTDYCLWPEAGQEWIRSSVAAAGSQDSHSQGIAFGSNILYSIDDDETSWAAALADGSIGILTTFQKDSIEFSWGVMYDSHQTTLAHPAIGLGKIDFGSSRPGEHSGPHLACCLRGGTVYCLPMNREDDDAANRIVPVFLPPIHSDLEEFDFLHGFAAGNIQMKTHSKDTGTASLHTDKLPIIVYSGEGGIMEVYACGLLPRSHSKVVEKVALQEMLHNGAMQMVLEKLQSMKDNDVLLQSSPLWTDARQEFVTWMQTRNDLLQKQVRKQEKEREATVLDTEILITEPADAVIVQLADEGTGVGCVDNMDVADVAHSTQFSDIGDEISIKVDVDSITPPPQPSSSYDGAKSSMDSGVSTGQIVPESGSLSQVTNTVQDRRLPKKGEVAEIPSNQSTTHIDISSTNNQVVVDSAKINEKKFTTATESITGKTNDEYDAVLVEVDSQAILAQETTELDEIEDADYVVVELPTDPTKDVSASPTVDLLTDPPTDPVTEVKENVVSDGTKDTTTTMDKNAGTGMDSVDAYEWMEISDTKEMEKLRFLLLSFAA